MNVKCICAVIIFILYTGIAYSQNAESYTETDPADSVIVFNEDFARGEELFQLNRPEEAIPFLEKCIDVQNINPDVYIYLGVAYYQTSQFEKSLSVFTKGLAVRGSDRRILAYNAGNSAYAMGSYARADACYAIAVKEDPSFSSAVLNRANAQLRLDHLADARENYVRYLELENDAVQKEKIEQLIVLLDEEIARRAKERPELIDPSDFVLPEDMEVPEIQPEKIQGDFSVLYADDGIYYEEPVPDELLTAPQLPDSEKEIEPVEIQKISDESVDDNGIDYYDNLPLPAEEPSVKDIVPGEESKGEDSDSRNLEKVGAEDSRISPSVY